MEATKGLTNLQLELVKLFSFEVSEDQLKELKQILVNYFPDFRILTPKIKQLTKFFRLIGKNQSPFDLLFRFFRC